ncbi:MAG: efflux RND transporter periplasmic adaptor subunit [Cyclobacteriaceae bacterium]
MKTLRTIFISLLASTFFMACQGNGETTSPLIEPLTEAVYSSGFVMPANDHKLYSQAEGVLLKVHAREGDIIKKGMPLFEIANVQQDLQLRKAQDAYSIAQENYSEESPLLQELIQSIETAKARMQNDSLNYHRYQQLLEKKAISSFDYEKSKLAYENSANEYKALRNKYEYTRRQLWQSLRDAGNQLSILADEKNRYIISSPIDGKVFEMYRQPGELIRRNEPVALIGHDSLLYLNLSIDELDIQRVKIDQPIKVKIDVYGSQVFNARVRKIYPMLNLADQSFRIDAEFTDPVPGGFVGLNVEANIIISQKTHAVTLPRRYVDTDNTVWIKDGKDKKKVLITTGVETFEKVEVLSGLDTTDVVIAL